jgi:hypothetical protein
MQGSQNFNTSDGDLRQIKEEQADDNTSSTSIELQLSA